MKNWKRVLCIAMAAMLSCPSVGVYASEQTYAVETEETEAVAETEETETVAQTEQAEETEEEELATETEENETTEDTGKSEAVEETEETETSEEVEDAEETESKETEITETEETEAVEEIGLDEATEETEELEIMQRAASASQPENPVYNENTQSTKWSYVYFGRYPQSEVTGDELDSSIINANYNVNGDAVVDGVKYRRVQEGNTTTYYRYEPIKWKVMQNDGNSLWLIADEILFGLNGMSADSGAYSTSRIRSMLNGYDGQENIVRLDYSVKGTNFYTMAFDIDERDIINPMTLSDLGVTDMITIPDYADVTDKEKGFGSNYSRAVSVTDYVTVYGQCWFYRQKDWMGYIDLLGKVYQTGWNYAGGVCPQIQISLDSDLWSMDCPEASFDAQSIEENSVKVTLGKKSYVYDGKAKTPTVKVKDGSETLTEGVDYTVTYLNNTQAGTTAAVRLDGTGDYIGSKTVYFTIEKADQTISVTKNITKKTNDKKFKLGAKLTAGNGALTYQSDKTSVAKVDRYGNITLCGGGTANITVTAKATTNYNAATAKVVLKVEKIKPSLTVAKTKFTKAYGDKAFEIDAETEEDVEITFASSDKKVVTVNADGKVSIKGCGTANITVKTVADNKYASAKKTIKVTVKPKKNSFTQASSKKKAQATLKWKKDSKASGYEIVYTYKGKSKKVDVKKNSTTSTTIKSLKSKKTYSVKIRSYKKVNGEKIYGDYSKVKKITVK